jgi:hypothetical protein
MIDHRSVQFPTLHASLSPLICKHLKQTHLEHLVHANLVTNAGEDNTSELASSALFQASALAEVEVWNVAGVADEPAPHWIEWLIVRVDGQSMDKAMQ